MTDQKISQLTDGGAPLTTDGFPVLRDGGNVRVNLDAADALTPVLTTDQVLVIRSGVIYLATVAAVLDAQAPSGGGGQFDFSDSDNSAYAAII